MPDLDAIVRLSEARAVVRSCQSHPSQKQWLPFGQMVWSEKNNLKWCTKYLQDPQLAADLKFFGTEVWAPSWSVVERERRGADVFIKIDAENHPEPLQALIVAVRVEIAVIHAAALRQRLEALCTLIPGASLVQFDRPWGRPFGTIAYTDALPDVTPSMLLADAAGEHGIGG